MHDGWFVIHRLWACLWNLEASRLGCHKRFGEKLPPWTWPHPHEHLLWECPLQDIACQREGRFAHFQLHSGSSESEGCLRRTEVRSLSSQKGPWNLTTDFKSIILFSSQKHTITNPRPKPCRRFQARWHTCTPRNTHSVVDPSILASERMSLMRWKASNWIVSNWFVQEK